MVSNALPINNAAAASSKLPGSLRRRERRFKGVRKRSWGKWVSEIRVPNSRARIWLGSYASAEDAARAFDAATLCLRGYSVPSSSLNFPDSPHVPFSVLMTPALFLKIAHTAARANTRIATSIAPANTRIATSTGTAPHHSSESQYRLCIEDEPFPELEISELITFDEIPI